MKIMYSQFHTLSNYLKFDIRKKFRDFKIVEPNNAYNFFMCQILEVRTGKENKKLAYIKMD